MRGLDLIGAKTDSPDSTDGETTYTFNPLWLYLVMGLAAFGGATILFGGGKKIVYVMAPSGVGRR